MGGRIFFSHLASLLLIHPNFCLLHLLTFLTSFCPPFPSIFCSFQHLPPRLPAPSCPEWTRVEASPSSSLQAPPLSASMTQSTAMSAERKGGFGDWGSFRTVSESTWANRVSEKQREGSGREPGRETVNRLVREVLEERQPMYNNISLPLWPEYALLLDTTSPPRFSSFLLFSPLSLQWKHIPVMPHCCSLFRFLITNNITRMGWSWPEHKTGRGTSNVLLHEEWGEETGSVTWRRRYLTPC